MKKLKIKKEKSINLESYLDLYEKFLNLPGWGKEKHQLFDAIEQYLSKHEVRIKRVKPNSKHNLCDRTHSFTIFKVPSNQLGKLYSYRDELVLVRCTSYTQGGWSQYLNEIYRFEGSVTNQELDAIKKRFGHWFILNNSEVDFN